MIVHLSCWPAHTNSCLLNSCILSGDCYGGTFTTAYHIQYFDEHGPDHCLMRVMLTCYIQCLRCSILLYKVHHASLIIYGDQVKCCFSCTAMSGLPLQLFRWDFLTALASCAAYKRPLTKTVVSSAWGRMCWRCNVH